MVAEKHIHASVVGSTFYHGAGGLLQRLRPGCSLRLVRQPDNPADKNAIGVFWSNTQLGHIPRGLAAELAPLMDTGFEITARQSTTMYVIELFWNTGEEVDDRTE